MLQCTPPTGHVVTFHFHFSRVNKEKLNIVIMKQSDIFVLDKCEITVDKNIILWTPCGLTNWESQKVLGCALLSPS